MKPLLAVIMLLFAAGGAEQKHRYIFVYTAPVQTQGIQTAIGCGWPGCNNVYHAEERHEWYDTLPEALEGMNKFEHPTAYTTKFGSAFEPFKHNAYEAAIGLYEVTEVPAKLVQIRTEKRSVQKTVEEDVPVMEWQVKP